jgi:nucleotide-binding universal stress UspA family protein
MIISGTDFSENATRAAEAAAALARRLKVPLKLVHVITEPSTELAIANNQTVIYDRLSRRLRDQSLELGKRFEIDVEPIAVPGFVCDKLIEIAKARQARLIVMSALGEKKQHQWLLGSTAERVAQASPIPVLVVRDSANLQSWANGDSTLRTMVGVEIGTTSKAALRWAADLRTSVPCELLIAHVAWPAGEHARLGITSPMPLDSIRPEIYQVLRRDLREWVGDIAGTGETTFTITPGWGRVDTHLASLAAEAKADLLVVGTHKRAMTARLWQGSVSRGVLHHASCNVVCVPRDAAAEDREVVTPFRRVLIPTDFSALANRAIPVGYGLVAPGGVVHLLHVVTRKPGEDDPNVAERLRALVPNGAAAKGVVTDVQVLPEDDAWRGIWQAAGRLGSDAICMGTHGRSGIAEAVLGSQAREVVHRAQQPVILVPPEREG